MRPGVFGNPFEINALGITRDESIARYEVWMLEQAESKTGIYEELIRLAKFMCQGEDIILICACAPLICHGNVIKEWLEENYLKFSDIN